MYAQSANSERAALADVHLAISSHEANIPVLKALELLASDDEEIGYDL